MSSRDLSDLEDQGCFSGYQDEILDFNNFKSVEPLPIEQNPSIPFSFKFSDSYVKVMGYFKAFIDSNELSQRSYNLTTFMMKRSTTDIVLFWFRRKILEELNSNLTQELAFVDSLFEGNPKSYQLWNHRKWLIKRIERSTISLQPLFRIINLDVRNFHCWSHINWMIREFNLKNELLSVTEHFITRDPSNASAWNARFQVLSSDEAIIQKEIEFAYRLLGVRQKNQAIWNYLVGISNRFPDFKEKIILMVSDYVMKYPKERTPFATIAYLQSNTKDANDAIQFLVKRDPIRKKYWTKKSEEQTLRAVSDDHFNPIEKH